ncbi:MAG TPA: phage tail protein [Actinomycetes bacterium]
MRLPGLAVPVDLPGPFAAEPSGVASAAGGLIAVTDTDGQRLVVEDAACGETWVLPGRGSGTFVQPCGVAIGPELIWVADAGAGAVLGVSRSRLQVVTALTGFVEPGGVQMAADGALMVLDAAAGRVSRFTGARLDPDLTFGAAAASALAANLPGPIALRFLATDESGVTWLNVGDATRLVRLAEDGSWLTPLELAAGRTVGAFALSPAVLAYADTATGAVVLVNLAGGTELGLLDGFRGPVSGLAWTGDGRLLVKVDRGAMIKVALAERRMVDQGIVVTGPLDAGVRLTWFRAFVDAVVPAGAAVELAAAQLDLPDVAPQTADWRISPSPDVRLDLLGGSAGHRYLHLRLRALPSPTGESPTIRQVGAHTESDGPEEHLPRIYRHTDEATFLARLLGHAAAALDHLEREIDGIASTINPDETAADALGWLAGWMAFDLPGSLDVDAWRELVPRALDLHERRGTPGSLRELVRLVTGAEISIDEDFRHRHIWLLGAELGSRLGWETGLLAIAPDGLVLSDPAGLDLGAPSCEPEIGSVTVGEAAPLPAALWGTVLYDDTAHRFRIGVNQATACMPGVVDAITAVIERERPAHTEFCVEIVRETLTVGEQATVGIDAFVTDGQRPSVGTSLTEPSLLLEGEQPGSTTVDSLTVGQSTIPTPYSGAG